MVPLVVACGLVSMVAATATGQGTPGGILQGTWEMQLQRTNCAGTPLGPPAQSVAIIMAGGTMMESQAPRPQAQKTPGEGVWRLVAGNTFAFRFKYFTFDATDPHVFTGWTIIAGEITVDAPGNTNTGHATIEVYNTSGALVATACADVSGTRFGL